MTEATEPKPALVILNPIARGGQGRHLYKKIEQTLRKHVHPQIVETDAQGIWQSEIPIALRHGIRIFLAAGGDGTVRAMVEQLMRSMRSVRPGDITIGGIGLGSSNDYHKPFSRTEANIPLKIDPTTPRRRDICRAQIITPDDKSVERFFTVSASMGFTAEGNRFFNSEERVVRWLKAHNTTLAIGYTAGRTIFSYQPQPATVILSDHSFETTISNLSILKTQFISGSFRVDTPAASDDGLLGINLCQTTHRLGYLRDLWDLSRGCFLGRANRRFWHVPKITVKTDQPVAVELDGEVFEATQVTFDVLDEWMKECL